MKQYLKHLLSGTIIAALAITLFAVPAMAGGDCGYGTDDIEDECDLWMVDNATEHWCVCYNHLDENGEYPITFGPEPHTFEEGRCTTCGRAQADDAAPPDGETPDNGLSESEAAGNNPPESAEDIATIVDENNLGQDAIDSVESISDGSDEENLATGEQSSAKEEEEQDKGSILPPAIAGAAVLAAGVGGFAFLKKKQGGLKK